MNRSLFLLLVLLLTGCASFQVSTLNHDPIYSIEGSDAEITVISNEFELQRLLRTDFNFRYDFAQYAISQPRSFDWNNRILGNRYSFYNPYYSRTQMWNDWVWGYTGWNSWGQPHRWSVFGYDRWGYNIHYGWNNHGWGYGWNNYQNNWGWRQGRNNYGWNNRYRGVRVNNNSVRGRTATIYKRRVINNTVTNDKTSKPNLRSVTTTESSSNGRGSRSRQIVPNRQIRINKPTNVQPRQIRRRPTTPVPQQPIRSQRTSRQRRPSGGGDR